MLEVVDLKKYFQLNTKQMRINQTKEKVKKAVDGISFEVKRGEIFGLLGPNGAGKTTTLRCLSTLMKPNEGEIIIDGMKISGNEDQIRAKICFLTNELKLDEHFTPNYTFRYLGKLYNLSDEYITKRKEILFRKFEIEKFAEVKIRELSTGMKQKLSIAVSLIHDPEIIIYDEPTNGLDVLTAKVVTDYLKELKDQGKTIILSTHIMNVAAKLCSRFGIILDGKIVALGTLQDILTMTSTDDIEDAFFVLYKQAKEGRL